MAMQARREMGCKDCPVRHIGLCRAMQTAAELSAMVSHHVV
jgi:hypothetical protein